MPWGRYLGGVPCQVQTGGTLPGPARGYLARGVPCLGSTLPRVVPCLGGTLLGGTLPGGTLPGGTLPGGILLGGTLPEGTHVGYPQPGQDGGYPARGTLLGEYQGRVPPWPGQDGGTLLGGYPVRTTEGVLTTRWAVCLLRSSRRTFLFTI